MGLSLGFRKSKPNDLSKVPGQSSTFLPVRCPRNSLNNLFALRCATSIQSHLRQLLGICGTSHLYRNVLVTPGNSGGGAVSQLTRLQLHWRSVLGQPKCSVTDSSNSLIPFQAICTPIQTRKNDDNCVITVIPVAPRIRASWSANP